MGDFLPSFLNLLSRRPPFFHLSPPPSPSLQARLLQLRDKLDDETEEASGPLLRCDAIHHLQDLGLSPTDAEAAVTQMEESGSVLRLRDRIYTRPEIVAELLGDILPESRLSVKKLEKEVKTLDREVRYVGGATTTSEYEMYESTTRP
jgi:hypothetical protein